MQRFIFAAIAASFLSLSAPSVATAASAEVKTQKAAVKTMSKDLKSFTKLRAKWEKTVAKGKSPAKVEGKIVDFVRGQLTTLRGMGVPTDKSKDTDKVGEWMGRYRDNLVAIRNAKAEGRKRNQMKELEQKLQLRVQRQEKKLMKLGG